MAPIADWNSWTVALPVGTLLASVMGSSHCVAMCGGLIVAFAPTRAALVRYHLARGGAYALLGALSGAFGQWALGGMNSDWLARGAAVAMSALLMVFAWRAWSNRASHFKLLPDSWSRALFRVSRQSPELAGALTALLPCGWLHSFVLAAAPLQSPARGALLLAAFWLGTLPALSLAPLLLRKLLDRFGARAPQVTAVLLLATATLTLVQKFAPGLHGVATHSGAQSGHCH